MKIKIIHTATILVAALVPATVLAQESANARAALAPVIDAHQHFFSPERSKAMSDEPLPRVTLPPELDAFLKSRIAAERDRIALPKLYMENAWFLESFNPSYIRTRDSIVNWWVGNTESPYDLVPLGYGVTGNSAFITSYLADGKTRSLDAHHVLTLAKGADGVWRIAAEVLTMGGPRTVPEIGPELVVAHLDSANIKRGLVFSLAYHAGRGQQERPGEYAEVQAENDWTAAQAARFPDRLIPFCSVNPLKSYAVKEVERCGKLRSVRGLKLHVGNSGVDFANAEHMEKLREVFAAANANRLAIAIHLAAFGRLYGRPAGKIFLEKILPAAPDVAVQIAHMGSPGRLDPTSDSTLAVLAEAVSTKDPRAKNLWFDISTVITPETSAERVAVVTQRIRQIGVERILYGTDTISGDHLKPRAAWAAFMAMMPLTDAEFRTIASNVPPYAR